MVPHLWVHIMNALGQSKTPDKSVTLCCPGSLGVPWDLWVLERCQDHGVEAQRKDKTV